MHFHRQCQQLYFQNKEEGILEEIVPYTFSNARHLSHHLSTVIRQNQILSSLHLTVWHTIPSSSLPLVPYLAADIRRDATGCHQERSCHTWSTAHTTSVLLNEVHLFHSQFETMQDTSVCLWRPWQGCEQSLSAEPLGQSKLTLASNQDTEHVPLPEREGFYYISTLLYGATEHCFPPGCCTS